MQVILFLLIPFVCTGCVSYHCGREQWVSEEANEREYSLSDHQIYEVVPRHRSQIRWYDLPHWTTWALFGNDDDGLWGEASCADRGGNSVKHAAAWWLRNPCHNLFFYVLGSAHCKNSQLTLLAFSASKFHFLTYKPEGDSVFCDEGSCFFLGFHGWKPFCSMRLQYSKNRRFDSYLGWRERGNFGGKFLPCAKVD